MFFLVKLLRPEQACGFTAIIPFSGSNCKDVILASAKYSVTGFNRIAAQARPAGKPTGLEFSVLI